jgi:uncharacterized membrane protein (UPF0182 family)
VDQQTDISRELSLWGQRGSRVIRGNLLAIPVSDTFIYVEPVYLEAKQEKSEASATGSPQSKGVGKPQRGTQPARSLPDSSRGASLPELKRVIVASGNHLVMEENLDKALSSVVGRKIFTQQTASATTPQTQDIYQLGALALEHYTNAKAHLREGNWAEYGRELQNLEKILEEISTLAKKEK